MIRTASIAWIIFLIGAISCAKGQVSAPATNPANGHLYYYNGGFTTWDAAEALAVSMGGHLVTIRNSQENDFIKNTFGSNGDFWIGLNDRAVEGSFQWVSGESSLYSNWTPGQPDNGGGVVEEDGVYMAGTAGGTWSDTIADFVGFISGAIIEVIPPPPNILRIQGTTNVAITWLSTSNIQYQVQYSSNLSTNGWTNLGSLVNATQVNSTLTDSLTNLTRRFYRVLRVF